ncbi:hypothetical protein CL614_06655 [archaeon]|nr:hypothetical protein [archaeon]|tara:strand:- start:633 stop:2195 length:1563 start_codon:yes stop_codon:yes gene_type:complete
MYRILSASKDTYITNKIINNSFRATDSNVGQASTLDLFKLYGESRSGSVENPIEISRLLVKFNLDPLRAITGSIFDISNSSFKASLRLSDVYGGQTTPSNFNIIVFPLSKSFDEGMGRNIVHYTDLDSSNFVTASVTSETPDTWYVTGANKQGLLGSDDIDIISSGNLSDDNGVVNLWRSQEFSTGEEDLLVDVTPIISGILAGQIPDCGFRISYSGSEETDQKTRFVKRFSSRNTSDYSKKPSLIIQYNDALQDHHRAFFFDLSGSLFVNNYSRNELRNFVSGAANTEISGSNCMILRLVSGSSVSGTLFQKIVTASQYTIGSNAIDGIYSASFAISQFTASNDGEIRQSGSLGTEIQNANSASFTLVWTSLDESVVFLSSSMVANRSNRTSFNNESLRLVINITNLRPTYLKAEKYRFRVFVEDIDRELIAKKLPFYTKSEIFTSMYYRIRDSISGDIVIPFDKTGLSTLCSTDSDGMYFDLYMDSLQPGRLYTVDFLISGRNGDVTFTDVAAKFRVE